MNNNLTYLAIVLDESSSMFSVWKETYQGLNAFLEEQKKQPGECLVTLRKFNTFVPEPVFKDRPIAQVEPLNETTYHPSGMTALLDCIGITIDTLGRDLAALPEALRPGHVIVVIQTDGEENVSREYAYPRIKKMIEHQKTKYSWDFVFLGSATDINVTATSHLLGIDANKTLGYAKGAVGTRNAFASVSNYVSSSRSCDVATLDSMGFSQADVDAALQPDDVQPVVVPVVTTDATKGIFQSPAARNTTTPDKK